MKAPSDDIIESNISTVRDAHVQEDSLDANILGGLPAFLPSIF